MNAKLFIVAGIIIIITSPILIFMSISNSNLTGARLIGILIDKIFILIAGIIVLIIGIAKRNK